MRENDQAGFRRLPLAARALWAKSGEPVGHGLLAHLLDVAAVAEALLGREPAGTCELVARAWRMEPVHAARWVATLAGLHDFGKAVPGFQAKWPDGCEALVGAGLPFESPALSCDQHAAATCALLTPLLQRVSEAPALWCRHAVQAIAAHHGYHFLPVEIDGGRPRREAAEWSVARQSVFEAYWSVLRPPGQPGAEAMDLPMVNWLAGLTSVADWIASNPEWFPLGERSEGLHDHFAHARGLAEQALDAVGWRRFRPLLQEPPVSAELDGLLSRIVGRPDMHARPLQRDGLALLREAKGPALLLVESPMGEGKTELAFLAHLHLQAANQHRGLYVALPTQATGNALFLRAKDFLRAFADGPLDVQLVHGGAAMNEQFIALRGVNHSAADTLSASAWFGQRRRPLLSAYGVGTVDQMLYAVLNVKHHFVRMWGLSNRVVVLDEVHAYDTYTSGLIITLVRWLRALRCSVVLMSATLPQARRRELLRAWGSSLDDPSVPYPRLSLADDSGTRACHVPARDLPSVRLAGVGSDIAEMAEAAIAAVQDGGCVAVIVNTVSRAQALYLALQARAQGRRDVALLLFHARFPADERAEREQQVLDMFGTHGERPLRAVLVATQVVEQSLDIDFDFMVSDLAPVDLILQRAGRLHRHTRPRPPAHERPRLMVAGLLPDAPLQAWKEAGWTAVYDPYILGRTWALLMQEAELRLPADIDRLVQAVYDVAHGLPETLDQAARQYIEDESYGAYLAKAQAARMQSFHIAVDPAAEPSSAYDGKPRGHEEDELGLGLQNSTRLGQESLIVVPVIVGSDGRWHVREGDAGFRPDCQLDGDTARALYRRTVRVNDRTLTAALAGEPVPPGLAGHPLLCHLVPLPCVEGVYEAAAVSVRLSPELGLVFEKGGRGRPPPSPAPLVAGNGAMADSHASQLAGSSPLSGDSQV